MTLGFEPTDDVADVDRTIELAGVRRCADQHDLGPGDLFASSLGFRPTIGILGFETLAIGLEDLLVRAIGAQGLLLREQEVARETILDGDDIADPAEVADAFEEYDIHVCSPQRTM